MGETPSARVVVVVLLGADLAVITAVLLVGLHLHAIPLLADPRHTILTVVPFLVGWLAAAPFFTAYQPTVIASPARAAFAAAATWITAALVGSLIRTTSAFPGDAPPVFVLIMIAAGLAALLPWRLVLAIVLHARGTPA